MSGAYFSCGGRRGLRRALSGLALSAALALAAAPTVTACSGNCATYILDIVVLDQTTGKLVCDATVTFFTGDAGMALTASSASSDAEIPMTSAACQWDTVVGGGTYNVVATAPGLATGSTMLNLPKDECGTATVPVTVILVRS